MNTTQDIQQRLLEAIFSDNSSDFDERGLAIYRQNLKATALNALRITFPTVNALVGDSVMRHASEKMLKIAPPSHGNWAAWGASFADILGNLKVLADYPFVADCARMDFICHQLARAEDHLVDIESLSILEDYEPDNIAVNLAPSLTLMVSDHPISEIRAAHQLPKTERKAALQRGLSSLATCHYIAIHRDGNYVSASSISKAEFGWYLLLKTHSLGQALDVIQPLGFSFKQWLLKSVKNNCLFRFSIN